MNSLRMKKYSRLGQRNGGKPLDKECFSTGEIRSQDNKLFCAVPRLSYTKIKKEKENDQRIKNNRDKIVAASSCDNLVSS